MQLISETAVNAIMDASWTAYRAAKRSIDILESIGLSVEGAAGVKPCDWTNDMSVLFEAQTGSENAMFAVAGIQRATETADKASALLSQEADLKDAASSADVILFKLRCLSDAATADTEAQPGLKPFEVTLSLAGDITVYGASAEDAMARANAMASDDLIQNGCWDSPNATDAYEG